MAGAASSTLFPAGSRTYSERPPRGHATSASTATPRRARCARHPSSASSRTANATCPGPRAPCVGTRGPCPLAALVAAVGAGLFSDLPAAGAAMLPTGRGFAPQPLGDERSRRLDAWRRLIDQA